MAIVNPSVVSAGLADKLWITHGVIVPTSLTLKMVPFDGTYLIGNSSLIRRLEIKSEAICQKIMAAAAQVIGVEVWAVRVVSFESLDPTSAIEVRAVYETGPAVPTEIDGQIVNVAPMATHSIPDLLAFIASDPGIQSQYAELEAAVTEALANG